jgi:hypothetical protein
MSTSSAATNKCRLVNEVLRSWEGIPNLGSADHDHQIIHISNKITKKGPFNPKYKMNEFLLFTSLLTFCHTIDLLGLKQSL